MEKPKVYLYVRFSTPDQAKGDSLRRQFDAGERFAREHGLELDDTTRFRDLGKSAYHGKNIEEGRLGDFIKAVEDGTIKPGSYLLIENLDRASRETPRKAFRQLERIIELGIVLVTLQDGKQYTAESLDENFHDFQYAIMTLYLGHSESKKKSIRVREAKAAARKVTVATNGKKPIGSLLPSWVVKDPATGALELHKNNAALVRRIFRYALDGMGHRSIAQQLNKTGIPVISVTKRNKQKIWHPSFVMDILNNPACIGHFQMHKMGENGERIPEGDLLESYFPPVVSPEVFYKVRDRRRSKRNAPGPKGNPDGGNLFQGIARCYACHSVMYKLTKGPGRGIYLVCSKALRGNGCKYTSYRYEDYELGILTAISEHIDWSNLGERIEHEAQDEVSRLETEHAALQAKLDVVERRLANIAAQVDAFIEDGKLMPQMLQDKLVASESDKADLSQQEVDIRERLVIEQGKVATAKAAARGAQSAFGEWLEKYSSASWWKRSIPKRDGVSDVERQDARAALKVRVADLVKEIWFGAQAVEGPEFPDVYLALRHGDPTEIHSVLPGGFTVFTEADYAEKQRTSSKKKKS